MALASLIIFVDPIKNIVYTFFYVTSYILHTLTGVVSGVASIAASGGEVPLLLLLGVGGAERGS